MTGAWTDTTQKYKNRILIGPESLVDHGYLDPANMTAPDLYHIYIKLPSLPS
jgi:hypothetical protein